MNIKIFVSNRIDLESENIHSDIYVPVRCGAIFDKRINLHIMGDDTGDNISEKRMSFCELTVQYWAWKNVEADYYGLCHYRRYLTSTDKKFRLAKEERNNGCFAEEYLTSDVLKKYGLDEARMSKFISQYDVIACSPIEARVTNWQAMKMAPEYHDIDDVHKAVSIVKELYPEMATIVDEYMNSKKIRLYNCFIMKKDIFFAYSKWLFSILFKLEKKIDMSTYGIQKYRTPGTIGERLFGIYCLYLSKQSNIKFRNQPLLFIEYPEKREILEPYFNETQVTIVSNFNDNYASVFSVFLLSALDYINSERNYEFIILGSDFTSEHKEYLEKIVESYKNVHISFCDPFSFLNGVELFVAHPEYSKDLYTRTIIPFILKKYKKVIVVDADTVCKNDLGFLYDVNLEGKTIGAVKDVIYGGYLNGGVPDAYEYTTEKLKLTNPYNYCNTGVLVIDCVLYRNKYTLEEIQRHIESHKYKIYEQDMLNVLFDSDIYFLDRRWNLFTYTSNFVKKVASLAPLNDFQEYEMARSNPYIIHYAAHPKPWWVKICDYGVEYWTYARKSPFYEEILSSLIWCTTQATVRINRESFPRRIANILFPPNTHRREILKKIIPKESPVWYFSKRIYYFFFHH